MVDETPVSICSRLTIFDKKEYWLREGPFAFMHVSLGIKKLFEMEPLQILQNYENQLSTNSVVQAFVKTYLCELRCFYLSRFHSDCQRTIIKFVLTKLKPITVIILQTCGYMRSTKLIFGIVRDFC